jgi:hypothetical protein
MLKVVKVSTSEGEFEFPVEGNDNWFSEAHKLLNVRILFVTVWHLRDPYPNEDLFEMLEIQWGRYCDFADAERDYITDSDYDNAIELYCKTEEAIDG